jgi:Family of unknown function (DUF6498)
LTLIGGQGYHHQIKSRESLVKNRPRITFVELWKHIDFSRFSTLSIIFSNALVILFAIVDRLSAIDLLWIYWFQSIIIGIFNFAKIITLKEFSTEGVKRGGKPVLPTKSAKTSVAVFFLFHYGFFHLAYAIFLGGYSIVADSASHRSGKGYLLYSVATFFVSYLIDFFKTKNEKSEKLPNLGTLMFAPYARIIPMHFTIILGGLIGGAGSLFSADTDLSIMVLFMGIKTVVDLMTQSVDFGALKKPAVKTPG